MSWTGHLTKRAAARRAGSMVLLGLLVATAAAFAASKSTAGRQSAKLELRVGFSGALSGVYAGFDQPVLNGITYAAKKINAAGGIDGVTVKISSADNKNEQTTTAVTTQGLLDQDIRVFILTVADTVIAQGRQVAAAGGISALGGQTAPELVRNIGSSTFMVTFGDNVQASAAAQYACKLGYRTAFTLASPEIPYTKFLPRYFADAFKHICKGRIVGQNTYRLGQTSYATQVTKVQNARPKPDVVYTPMYPPDTGVFLKQLRSTGSTIPVVTADGNDTTLLVSSSGKVVDGLVYTTHGFPTPGSINAKFHADYQKVMGQKPETNTLEGIGRDNLYVLVTAAAHAHSTDPEKILTAALRLKNFPGVTGTLTMNPRTRIPIKEVTLVKMRGTKRTFVEAFIPKYIAPPYAR